MPKTPPARLSTTQIPVFFEDRQLETPENREKISGTAQHRLITNSAMRRQLRMSVDRSNWPMMVRVGLWGLQNWMAAWGFFWVSLAIAAGCVAYGFVNPRAFIGGLALFAALWYYLCIRWVDQHGSWL